MAAVDPLGHVHVIEVERVRHPEQDKGGAAEQTTGKQARRKFAGSDAGDGHRITTQEESSQGELMNTDPPSATRGALAPVHASPG